jgi:hypothetical protein
MNRRAVAIAAAIAAFSLGSAGPAQAEGFKSRMRSGQGHRHARQDGDGPRPPKTITIDAAYVRDRLDSIAGNSDLGSEQDVSDAARGPVRLSAGRSIAEAEPERVRCLGADRFKKCVPSLALNRAIHLAR